MPRRSALPRLFLYPAAALLFLGAALLDSRPQLPPATVPDPQAVAATKTLADTLLFALQKPSEADLTVTEEQLASSARVVAYGVPAVRGAVKIEGGTARFAGSLQLARRSWINARMTVASYAADEEPRVWMSVGSVKLPPLASRELAEVFLSLIWDGPGRAPQMQDIVRSVEIAEDSARLSVNLPRALIRDLQRISGRSSEEAAREAKRTFLHLTRPHLYFGEAHPLAELYSEAFSLPPAGGELSQEEAAGRVIGVAMAIHGPEMLRIVDLDAQRRAASSPQPLPVEMAGRRDLALHFAISAAFAATGDTRLMSAIGEVKELSDSLPGGSGFSFVDLAADRAGLRLGESLASEEMADRTQQLLARARAGDLFPAEALGMTEGLTDAEFEARFGQLDSARYQSAVAQIDAALNALPVYLPE